MRDEEYVFFQDVREKKVTGYSARKQRSHCGKAGCKLPSDYLTKKEIKNMSGECKSYRLNEPMSFKEFKAMPDDIQETYIKALRAKYNVSDAQLAKMFGASQATVSVYLRKKGLNRSGKFSGKEEWDKEGFYAWAYGVPKQEDKNLKEILAECNGEDVEMYETVNEEVPAEEVKQPEEVVQETPIVEDDLPWNESEQEEDEPVSEPAHHTYVTLDSLRAIPDTGSMTFTGNATQIMNTLVNLLGGAKVLLSVKWDVVED